MRIGAFDIRQAPCAINKAMSPPARFFAFFVSLLAKSSVASFTIFSTPSLSLPAVVSAFSFALFNSSGFFAFLIPSGTFLAMPCFFRNFIATSSNQFIQRGLCARRNARRNSGSSLSVFIKSEAATFLPSFSWNWAGRVLPPKNPCFSISAPLASSAFIPSALSRFKRRSEGF